MKSGGDLLKNVDVYEKIIKKIPNFVQKIGI